MKHHSNQRRMSFTPTPRRTSVFEGTPLINKPDYGLDCPRLIRRFFICAILLLSLGTILVACGTAHSLPFLPAIGLATIGLGALCVLVVALMVRSSRRGKHHVRDVVLDELELRGNEKVLDAGCGRGLMLLGAAKRVEEGRVVGVDIWSQEDQYKNAPENTLANAVAEGIPLDRVRLQDGDLRDLSFIPSYSFDVVLSSLTIHSIRSREGRRQAIAEMVRVLRPGGRIALLDLWHVGECAQMLEQTGWVVQVRRSGIYWSMFPPVRVVYAVKREWGYAEV
ncbi:methyltransferase type 11 [Jimgerdemannia flammicorona]|uniref:Methyltransferase type 11 n=2 Tax=Jimgerdemannia flammicorona TaxID=994334 RepID=A0A432ZYY6_9FUNG|nr:methyltransferase type 11 [Jimgerdemannia flammicorona]RUS14584.1 methyltransferase type 11 [Jimgerdemannia flammicorona]